MRVQGDWIRDILNSNSMFGASVCPQFLLQLFRVSPYTALRDGTITHSSVRTLSMDGPPILHAKTLNRELITSLPL